MKSASWSESSKLVAVVIDEMALKEGLSYDKGRDLIEGFIPAGKQLANHALVHMVRGLTEKWKQAVGYFLSSGPISAADIKVHLLECITRFKDVGLKVVVIIGDQGSNNRNLFQSLLRCTIDKPFFVYNNNKVILLYDPSHLLKSIRNNFRKHWRHTLCGNMWLISTLRTLASRFAWHPN